LNVFEKKLTPKILVGNFETTPMKILLSSCKRIKFKSFGKETYAFYMQKHLDNFTQYPIMDTS
jgi:hypothetical protein